MFFTIQKIQTTSIVIVKFFLSRFHSRRNYLINSESYGQSLLDNYDDLEYSFEDCKGLEEETLDICEECQQNNLLLEIDSISKDPNEIKNVRGCRRNQHVIHSTKHNLINIDNEINKNKVTSHTTDTAEKTPSTNFIRASAARTEKMFKNNWKKIKKEFSSKLIDIPDEYTTKKDPPTILGQDVKNNSAVVGYNAFPANRLNASSCSCNDNETNNYCNNHQCLLRYRSELPKNSNTTSRNNGEDTVYCQEPILAPIQGVALSRQDE